MERSIADMAAEAAKKTAAMLRHYSLTKMLRTSGIRRSPTRQCDCGRVISSNKEQCFRCMSMRRVDAEVKAVPCEARIGN